MTLPLPLAQTSNPDFGSRLLDHLHKYDLVPLTFIVGGVICGLVAMSFFHYRSTKRTEFEATLKLEMIKRGMSAAEIERVLSARLNETLPSETSSSSSRV